MSSATLVTLVTFLATLLLSLPLAAADQAPLMTRWAADVNPDHVHPEYPRPQCVRADWLNLNGTWQYRIPSEDLEPPAFSEPYERRILVPFPVESALSGVMERHDRIHYRRTFHIPRDWQGDRVLLHFGAVDFEAIVFVNSYRVGAHRGGYDAFTFDITDYLIEGRDQELIVQVWDPSDAGPQPCGKQANEPRGIWYTPTTGIWQTVWLEPVPATGHIDALRLTPDLETGRLTITCDEARIPNAAHLAASITLPDGAEVRAAGPPPLTLDVPDIRPWSPDDPYLYDVDIELRDRNEPGHVLDRVSSYVGFRTIAVGPDDNGIPRLMLNGEEVFHLGTLDQGFWPDGLYTAPTDEALRYDIEITKMLGFNTIRKHVKIEPDRWYYWCDRLGVLVWQDMPSGDARIAPGKGEIDRTEASRAQFDRELTAMVSNLYNHPSIVMWVTFNEGWGQHETDDTVDMIRDLDPTRLINPASGWNDLGGGDVLDIHSYPGPAAPRIETIRAGVLGEFGGLGLPVEGHTWTEHAWGYRGMETADELADRYERLLRRVWRLRHEAGLAAAIYTQITDVETECNGLLTYDRAVIKIPIDRVNAAHAGEYDVFETIVPTAATEPATWRYTFEQPDEGWHKPDFNDADWSEGLGGFGLDFTPGSYVNTNWDTSDIWIRRRFTMPIEPDADLRFAIHYDEDAEVYINGVLALEIGGYTTSYEDETIAPEALAALRKGENVIAVHCMNRHGGAYIDVGFVRRISRNAND